MSGNLAGELHNFRSRVFQGEGRGFGEDSWSNPWRGRSNCGERRKIESVGMKMVGSAAIRDGLPGDEWATASEDPAWGLSDERCCWADESMWIFRGRRGKGGGRCKVECLGMKMVVAAATNGCGFPGDEERTAAGDAALSLLG
jgi:hypothetical protein